MSATTELRTHTTMFVFVTEAHADDDDDDVSDGTDSIIGLTSIVVANEGVNISEAGLTTADGDDATDVGTSSA